MAFSINTNIASLQAQDSLRLTSDFQNKTINRVTSGLRIVSSGDDAAGLAIANTYRSDRAVLTQGVRNANDGLSTLQTIDGGMNNIGQLLDRARTLAAQSASGTFNGDRGVLNSEFGNLVGEIDRQAQSIGLDVGGTFSKELAVFIGGGRKNNGTSVIDNGSVSVDLSASMVDAKSLGLKGVQAAAADGVDIGSGSASTSVEDIVGNTSNTTELAGYTDFYFRGSGFSGADRVKVSANLAGVTDTGTLVTAINAAIDAAGAGAASAATAFKNAGIRASVLKGTDGKERLAFTSSSSAFQVSAGDLMSNALMGNYTSASDSTGQAMINKVTGGSNTAADATTFGGTSSIKVRFQSGGLASPVDITLNVTAATTVATAVADLSSQVANSATLKAAGIVMENHSTGTKLAFDNKHGEKFDVSASGDLANQLGFGSYRQGGAGEVDYTTITGANITTNTSETLEFSIGGASAISVGVTSPQSVTEATNQLNQAFAANSTLAAAGLKASFAGTAITVATTNGTAFRIGTVGNSNAMGFGNASYTGTADAAETYSTNTTPATFDSAGTKSSGLLAFSGITLGSDEQSLMLTANDTSGTSHSVQLVLRNDTVARNARTIDEAVKTINDAIQQSNDSTMQKIVAVKEKATAGGAEGIRFLTTLGSFKAEIGTNGSGTGVGSQGTVVTASSYGTGSTADISTQDNAKSAVSALASAVSILGSAQAVVGKGQNQFGYAINLAQTHLSNLAAAESRIRDADLAAEAANLTKAQILSQAGIAALAQANSAPQAVLSLLRG